MPSMTLAVASGKGGTGKTTVATNLSAVLAAQDQAVTYVDCDVEEPNGHIFMKPTFEQTTSVGVPVPDVDAQTCTLCGACGEICQYSAIVPIGKKVLVFPELCHGCGGCTRVCPVDAITEQPREVGVMQQGRAGPVGFVHGRLRVGEAMAVPLIREVKRRLPTNGVAVLDVPPGTSCPVIESVRGVDFVLMVTEPTPFGLNDLKLAVQMVRALELPTGVVINRADVGDDGVQTYCHAEGLDVLLEIPDDRRVAEAYSRGVLAVEACPEYRQRFARLFESVCEKVGR